MEVGGGPAAAVIGGGAPVAVPATGFLHNFLQFVLRSSVTCNYTLHRVLFIASDLTFTEADT